MTAIRVLSVLVVLGFVATCYAACQGEVLLQERQGAGAEWRETSGHYMIYDLIVNNTGTCRITSVINPWYVGGVITQSWNLINASITGGGDIVVYGSILPGTLYSAAGFIAANVTRTELNNRGAPLASCSVC